MTNLEYQIFVNQCNTAIIQKNKKFLYEGQNFGIEFRYILAAMADNYGYKATFDDKTLIIKPQ